MTMTTNPIGVAVVLLLLLMLLLSARRLSAASVPPAQKKTYRSREYFFTDQSRERCLYIYNVLSI